MIEDFYYIVLSLFFVGGILVSFTNRSKPSEIKRKSWIKYFSYFIIVNSILLSILIDPQFFYFISLGIVSVGLFEITYSTIRTRKVIVGLITLSVYLVIAFVFTLFSRLEQNILLFTYVTVTIFDAFSQLFGQLLGKTRLVPRLSPNKTLEGLIGSLIITTVISVFFANIIDFTVLKTMCLSVAISVFALIGDLSESFNKRMFGIKDYSKLLPGQGGFLDRFDSLLFASVIIVILNYFEYL